jgi:hypothetical protein
MERPESIWRELSARREERCCAQGILERSNRAGRVPGHEKAEPIELRQALCEDVTSFLFQENKL